jgi:hypothetical protein
MSIRPWFIVGPDEIDLGDEAVPVTGFSDCWWNCHDYAPRYNKLLLIS